jgi:hypothetical protein
MKKLQLLALIALSGTIAYHSQTSAWTQTIYYDNTKGGIQTAYSTGGVVTINGKIVSPTITNADKIETKKVDITGVKSINASGLGNLIVEECITCPEILTITAHENVMPYLKHEFSGKKLHLGLKDDANIQTLTPTNFHAVVKDINKISILTSGSVASNIFYRG